MASGTGHMTKQIMFLNSAWIMGSDWYITSLDHIHFCLIPILEILCHSPNYQWINESMNQWKKSLSSGLIKNESYFVRTCNLQCRWVRLHQITANVLIITIYGIRDRSHDQTNKIFELSLKNGVKLIYNITRSYSLLPHSHFGNTLPQSKLWMNEWKSH